MTETLNRKNALDMIDRELSYGGKPGSHFLNGWVKIEGETGCIRHADASFISPPATCLKSPLFPPCVRY